MSLTAPARPNRLRSHPAAEVDNRPDAVPMQTILSVEFSSPDGRTLQAIGGGDTLAAESPSPTTAAQPVRRGASEGLHAAM